MSVRGGTHLPPPAHCRPSEVIFPDERLFPDAPGRARCQPGGGAVRAFAGAADAPQPDVLRLHDRGRRMVPGGADHAGVPHRRGGHMGGHGGVAGLVRRRRPFRAVRPGSHREDGVAGEALVPGGAVPPGPRVDLPHLDHRPGVQGVRDQLLGIPGDPRGPAPGIHRLRRDAFRGRGLSRVPVLGHNPLEAQADVGPLRDGGRRHTPRRRTHHGRHLPSRRQEGGGDADVRQRLDRPDHRVRRRKPEPDVHRRRLAGRQSPRPDRRRCDNRRRKRHDRGG